MRHLLHKLGIHWWRYETIWGRIALRGEHRHCWLCQKIEIMWVDGWRPIASRNCCAINEDRP